MGLFLLYGPHMAIIIIPAAGPPRILGSCQLMSRHWVIRDATGNQVDEIIGESTQAVRGESTKAVVSVIIGPFGGELTNDASLILTGRVAQAII